MSKPRRSRPARILRSMLVPAIGLAFIAGAASVVSGILSKPAAAVSVPETATGKGLQPRVSMRDLPAEAGQGEKAARLARTLGPVSGKPHRDLSEIFGAQNSAFATDAARQDRFQRAVQAAALSSEKLALAFAEAGMDLPQRPVAIAVAQPSAERFDPQPRTIVPGMSVALAYADPSPKAAAGALAALSTVAPTEDEAAVSAELPDAEDADGTGLSPDYADTPDDTPVPGARPKAAAKDTGDADDGRPRERTAERQAVGKPVVETPDKPGRRALEGNGRGGEKLAYAKPENPAEKPDSGGILKNLFGRTPRAGNGVAVYDIAAAKVYMPDGSVLEAHSGIGKMADNPRYVHVKMNGPTPPHTYNLRMREKRFHGVEAIRMLPVDGKNKHGRDGFLTHSYLLRGGRAESHGCVAFKDYNKFLNAFKKGKVKQIVVVPGGGKAIALAKNGRDT